MFSSLWKAATKGGGPFFCEFGDFAGRGQLGVSRVGPAKSAKFMLSGLGALVRRAGGPAVLRFWGISGLSYCLCEQVAAC